MRPGMCLTLPIPSLWLIRFVIDIGKELTQAAVWYYVCAKFNVNHISVLFWVMLIQMELALAYGCPDSVDNERLVEYIHHNRF